MPRAERAQLSIRSSYARDRAAELVRATGMTATKVVEEALRVFDPASVATDRPVPPGRLVWDGGMLVMPATGHAIGLAETNAAIEAARHRDDPA